MKTKEIQELYQIKLHSMDVMMPASDIAYGSGGK